MRKFILSVLVCVSALFAANNDLSAYVINESSFEILDSLTKSKDTTEIFEFMDENKTCVSWNGEIIDGFFNDSLDKYFKFDEMIKEFCPCFYTPASPSCKKVMDVAACNSDNLKDCSVELDSAKISELKQYVRNMYRLTFDTTTVIKFLEPLKDIVFADMAMMHDYASSLFASSLGVCTDPLDATDKDVRPEIWDEKDLKNVFKRVYGNFVDSTFNEKCTAAIDEECVVDLSAASKAKTLKKCVAKRVLKSSDPSKSRFENDCRLNQKLLRGYRNLKCSENQWKNAKGIVDTLYAHLLHDVVEIAVRKEINFADTIPIEWHAKDCGCSMHKELNGNVYAIYPYWLAHAGGDTLDFTVITRIGYYGIRADNNGYLKMPSNTNALKYLDNDGYTDFVNVAHKHDVKVDWVIRKDDWSHFTKGINREAKLGVFFETLISQLDSLLKKKNSSFFKTFVDKISVNRGDEGLRGDGVTLWFNNYPTDTASVSLFKKFFAQLQDVLHANNEFATVNLMMNSKDLAEKVKVRNYEILDNSGKNLDADSTFEMLKKGIYDYKFFKNLLSESDTLPMENLIHSPKNFLIVLNNEPVSRNKLIVYNDLNRQLDGDARTAVLHAVVPMLWLDFKYWQQLQSDASFYNDAFYSLGVAPYGYNGESSIENMLSRTLLENFEKEGGSHKPQNAFSGFFCTYRWIFRLLNTMVYVLVFALLICYVVICRLATYFDERPVLFLLITLLPPLLTTLILANFDPVFMNSLSSVGGVGFIWRWGWFILVAVSVTVIRLLQVNHTKDIPKRKKKDKADKGINY